MPAFTLRGRQVLMELMALRRGAVTMLLTCAFMLHAAGASAQADESTAAGQLSGVLKRIRDAGAVRIGYRESSIPFSFEGPGGQPYGYSIELCHAIVEEIADAIPGPAR